MGTTAQCTKEECTKPSSENEVLLIDIVAECAVSA